MIKKISEKTNSPNISIDSVLINNNLVESKDAYTGVTSGGYLFVKLTFNGLTDVMKIAKLKLHLGYKNNNSAVGFKVIKSSITAIDSATVKLERASLTGGEAVIDQVVVKSSNQSANVAQAGGANIVTFDVTNVTSYITPSNPTVVLIIKNDYTTDDELVIHVPEALSNEIEACTATITEVCGLSSSYKYDSHSFGNNGNFNVNLCNGLPIYDKNLFQTMGNGLPITFLVYQNFNNTDGVAHIKKKLVPNFHYRIYLNDEDYVIEDPTGYKNYYTFIDRNDENVYLNDYGIKHIENQGSVYYSFSDNSYFYLTEESGVKTFKCYDKNNNTIEYKLDSTNAKIQSFTNKLGQTLTYSWNGARLLKIINNLNEEMTVTYTNDGYIDYVVFPSEKRKIKFVYGTDQITISTYNIPDDSTQADELVEGTKLYFSSNLITKIEDIVTGYYILPTYTGSQVTKVSLFNSDSSEEGYYTTYSYNSVMTEVEDYKGNVNYYYFDKLGMIKTILDDKGYAETFNYGEVVNGQLQRLTGKTLVQTNLRNLVKNHSFEIDSNSNNSIYGWTTTGSLSTYEIVDGGFNGNKCLKINSNGNEVTTVYQTIEGCDPSKKYRLTGFIKHPNLTTEDLSKFYAAIFADYTITTTPTLNPINTYAVGSPVTTAYSINSAASMDVTKTDWYEICSEILEIPSNAENLVLKVMVYMNNIATTIYLDDIQIEEEMAFSKQNLVKNGFFEFDDSYWESSNLDTDDGVKAYSSSLFKRGHTENYSLVISQGDIEKDVTTSTIYKIKSVYQNLLVKGNAGDRLTLSVMGKASVSDNMIFRCYLKINYNDVAKTYYFDFDKNCDCWQLLVRNIETNGDYTSIDVGIEYDGGVQAVIDCVQLYKGAISKHYNYDYLGNVTEAITSNSMSKKIIYNENNQVIEEHNIDGSWNRYRYDGKGRVSSIKDNFGNEIIKTYDDYNRITKNKIISSEGNVIEELITYNDLEKKEVFTDSYNYSFTSVKDHLNRLIQSQDPNSLVTSYAYNNKSQITSLSTTFNNASNTLEYNNVFDNIKKIASSNGSQYTYEYNNFGLLTKVLCNDNVIGENLYDIFSNGINKGLLTKKIIGNNGDYYEFVYNDDDLLKEIKFNGTLLVQYKYDESRQIYKYQDFLNNVTKYYSYDLEGKLLWEKDSNNNTIKYSYDNLGNVQEKQFKFNGETRQIEYDYEYEQNEYNRVGYFNRLARLYQDEVIISDNSSKGVNGGKTIMPTVEYKTDEELNMTVFKFSDIYDQIWYDLTTFNRNRVSNYAEGKVFDYNAWYNRFYYNKTFYAWVRVNDSFAKENIFVFQKVDEVNDINNILSKLYVKTDGTIAYSSIDGEEKIASTEKLVLNEWNLIGIKFTTNGYLGTGICNLIVNGTMSESVGINEYVYDINRFFVGRQDTSIIIDVTTSTGVSETLTALTMPFEINFISVGSYDYTAEDMNAIYIEGKKYFEKENTDKYNTITYYDKIYDNLDVISLTNSLESKNGIKPYYLASNDSSYILSKTKVFKYDDSDKNHSFASYGKINSLNTDLNSHLAYKLGLTTSGTISLLFKLTEPFTITDEYRTVFTSIIDGNEAMGVYVTNEGKICVRLPNGFYNTDRTVNLNEWNHLLITYDSNEIISKINNSSLVYSEMSNDLTNAITYIGSSPLTGKTNLYGHIKTLAFSQNKLSSSDITVLRNKVNPISVRKVSDSLGRVKECIWKTQNYEYTTTYTYDKYQVIKEEDTLGRSIEYEYDSMGNVTRMHTKINGNSYSDKTYEYDALGRLYKIIQGNNIKTYTYDNNGNIRFVENKTVNTINGVEEENIFEDTTYVYSSSDGIKDKLRWTNNNLTQEEQIHHFLYKNTANPFLPTQMTINGVQKDLTWNGKNLTKVGTDVTYTYNANGIRTSKTVGSTVTTYELEGDKIVQMTVTSGTNVKKLDFIYDASNMLVGIQTIEGVYYYVRDVFGNITGILDENGNYVIEYYVDEWGKLRLPIGESVMVECIAAEYNPFIYKGYYYDTETQLFYCNSRYYSPELCRWISPDSIEYLDPESINGLNLYCYCENNPIYYYDPNGHSVIMAMLIGAGIGLVLGLAGQLVADVGQNILEKQLDFSEWELSSWQTYVGAGLGGAIGGALTPFLNPIATAFITGTSSSIIGMGLEKITGASDYSLGDIFFTSFTLGTISGITAGVLDNVKIPGITSGRGSLSAVQKQINTKLVKGTIKNVSMNTIRKMALLEIVNSIPSAIYGILLNEMMINANS